MSTKEKFQEQSKILEKAKELAWKKLKDSMKGRGFDPYDHSIRYQNNDENGINFRSEDCEGCGQDISISWEELDANGQVS